ncbi:MAG: FAD-dependent monooxygenase [Actinomycetaceae bacterium]|nr:FAD-dependent monooxygenase [Actinomycetaceae bacterium]
MQFHHHGYVSTNPRVEPAAGVGLNPPQELPEKVDVLIVGSGPAGMITAAQLAQFPNVTTALIERRDDRLYIGHADGVQARSVETFQAFGFANEITDEAYRITETSFWKPDPNNPDHIIRSGRTEDDPLGISEFPHLIVNQARVLDYFREFAYNSPARLSPYYGWEFVDLTINDGEEYPVQCQLKRSAGEDEGKEFTVYAKYVLGADGAHSRVRRAIGVQHLGGVSYHAWGVMDILLNTDFPDIRTKCIIQSNAGSILHIPREGGYLVRMYVDLGEVAEDDNHAVRNTPLEEIIARANAIVAPYSLDVREVAWWSVYEVGHRVTDRFDEIPVEEAGTRDPHVFIAGDACHTHSAKAGQGMNVSMQDGFNLAWKLGHVLSGLAPASLLASYTAERQEIAQNLIDFDLKWSSMMAKNPASAAEGEQSIEDYYVATAEFPAGFMTQYKPSLLIGDNARQDLAAGFPLGKRFKSTWVSRRSDGNTVQLGHLHRADGRWRIYVFADELPGNDGKVDAWGDFMANDPSSPVRRFTPKDGYTDALFDIKVIYPQSHTEFEPGDVPQIFKPKNGALGLVNLEKIFGTLPNDSIFRERQVSKEGAVVVVRPDMYVAHILPLDATAELAEFFAGIYQDQ